MHMKLESGLFLTRADMFMYVRTKNTAITVELLLAGTPPWASLSHQ